MTTQSPLSRAQRRSTTGVLRTGSALLVLGIVGSSACHDAPTTVPSVQLLVRSDKLQYSLAFDVEARTELVNLGPAVVYAPMNEYVYVERFDAGRWQDRHPWFAVDGVGSSFPVDVGDTLSGFSMSFAYVDRRPGVYRFVFEVAFDSLGHRLVPEEQRVSPSFELTP